MTCHLNKYRRLSSLLSKTINSALLSYYHTKQYGWLKWLTTSEVFLSRVLLLVNFVSEPGVTSLSTASITGRVIITCMQREVTWGRLAQCITWSSHMLCCCYNLWWVTVHGNASVTHSGAGTMGPWGMAPNLKCGGTGHRQRHSCKFVDRRLILNVINWVF